MCTKWKNATVVAKQFEKPTKVSTRVFVSRFEPKSSTMREVLHANTPYGQCVHNRVSANGVTEFNAQQVITQPPSFIVGRDNQKSVPIVNAAAESRTSCYDNWGGH